MVNERLKPDEIGLNCNRDEALPLKASALATGTLLLTPYLFLDDMMVLAIAVGFPLRIGLTEGFRHGELASLACARRLLIASSAV